MQGHLFVVRGDLTRLECDAWLLPTDRFFDVGEHWRVDPQLVSQVRANAPEGWGSTLRTLRLDLPKRPTAWLTDTGGYEGLDPTWYTDAVRAFVREAAAGPAGHGREVRLLAVPAVGIGAGGQASSKGGLLLHLLATLRACADEHEVDVALVTRDARVFAAAQAERRAHERWDDLGDDLAAAADDLGRRAAAGDLVLFVGAGVGVGAGLPTWNDLLDDLAKNTSMDTQLLEQFRKMPSSLDRARIVESRLGSDPTRLRRLIVERIAGADRPALAHALLTSLPVREVATTNYDRLLEAAAEGTGREFAVIPYEPAHDRDRWLLKLHGDVGNADDIVFTREDYLRYGDRRGALAGIIQALLITRHMLFVGFSLTDDNFHRIADDVRKALGASRGGDFGTALVAEPNELMEDVWRDDVRFIEFGTSPSITRALDLFLDRMALASSSATEYLLDPSYSEMLTGDEQALASLLRQVEDAAAALRSAPAWQRVAQLLRDLGSAHE
jgi:hypothetical protein